MSDAPAPKSLQPHDFPRGHRITERYLEFSEQFKTKNRRMPRALVSENTLVAEFLNVFWFL